MHKSGIQFVWRDFVLILILGSLVRIVIACGLQYALDQQHRFDLIAGDAEGYWELALDLYAGRDYALYDPPRYVERMPGFPVLLVMPMAIFGANVWAVRIWLALLGGLTCGIVYLLGCQMTTRRNACVAAGIAMLSPFHAGYSVLFLSETAFALCMLWALVCWKKLLVHISANPIHDNSYSKTWTGYSNAVWLGMAQAMAIYMKPSWGLAPWGMLLLTCLLCVHRSLAVAGYFALSIVVIGLCLLPWGWRNYRVTGHFVSMTLWSGPSLYDGLNPHADGSSNMAFVDRDKLSHSYSEYEVDQIYRQRAKEFATANPGRVAVLAMVKLWRYFKPWASASEIRSWWGHLVIGLSWVVVVAGGLLGLMRGCVGWRDAVILIFPLVYFAAIHMVFVSSMRYRLPADYTLMIPAGIFWMHCWNRISKTEIVTEN
jgi:4-amino-4-deoxy-L-arabinose transferase-like glycosyltransferase